MEINLKYNHYSESRPKICVKNGQIGYLIEQVKGTLLYNKP